MIYVTADEMREIDSAAIEEFGIDVLSLMENAGVATAILARRLMGGITGKKVACLIGKGNNGGDGLVAARHLHDWGAEVRIFLGADKDSLGDVTSRHLRTLEAMGVAASQSTVLEGFDLIIDALLGYNAKGPPREPVASMIRTANKAKVPLLALDIPSGLDPTSGTPNDPCIEAKATLTLGLPKTGFLNPSSKRFVGELYVGDVSIPREVYVRFSMPTPPFGREQVVRIW